MCLQALIKMFIADDNENSLNLLVASKTLYLLFPVATSDHFMTKQLPVETGTWLIVFSVVWVKFDP